jgi:hypothetical protein
MRYSAELGFDAGEEMANIVLDAEMRRPGVRSTTRQIKLAAEAMFKGVSGELNGLRECGATEADLAVFVQAILDGFRERGASNWKLVKIAAIADATWLARLVPTAPAEKVCEAGAPQGPDAPPQC